MTTQELTRHIERTTGKLFVSEPEIVKLGFGKDTVKDICRNLDAITVGKERKQKRYYIGDVSKAIIDRRILHG